MTIEIADDLLKRAQRLARGQRTTLRALVERGLRLVLAGETRGKLRHRARELRPLVTYGNSGTHPEFRKWSWPRIRDEIYAAPKVPRRRRAVP